jgi:hypothetical protein
MRGEIEKIAMSSAAVIVAHIKLTGGWIDVAYDGTVLALAAVGPPLHFLVKPPTSIPARHKQTEERGRLRRLAVSALREAGAPDGVDEADVNWSYRAG